MSSKSIPLRKNDFVKAEAYHMQKKNPIAKQQVAATRFTGKWSPYLPGIALFLGALILALLTYKDYGVSWDEPFRSSRGHLSFNYIFHGDPALFSTYSDYHGTSYELLLVIIQKILRLTDSRDIYLMRHLVTHIFFLVSALCGYVLIYRLFKNRFLASLGFLMFVFAPRLYAHSFFNSKDIPFAAMILIVLTLCQVAFEKNKPVLFFALGMACGFATSIRVMGVMLAVFIVSFLLIDLGNALLKKEKPLKQGVNILLFSAGFCILLYAGWPYLWENPMHNLAGSFNRFAHYDVWNGAVLFNGRHIRAVNLPWTYIPTWFLITNPEIWLITGIAGITWICVNFFTRSWAYLKNTRERNFLLYLACFFVPVLAVILLRSVVYNGWRHLYFVYPPFVLLAVYFIDKMMRTRYKLLVQAACIIQLVFIGWFMAGSHPFHQVYFNNLTSHKPDYLRHNYDMDYWGCSYKDGLEHLVEADRSKVIKVYCDYPVLLDNNILLLPEQDRSRIQIVDKKYADYFFTNFLDHPYDYPPYKTEYSATVLNSTIFSIFKLEKDPEKLKQIRQAGINNMNEVLATDPDNYFERKEVGRLYFLLLKYDSAVIHLEKALALQPSDPDLLDCLAGVLKTQKKYPEAIVLFKKLHALNVTDDNSLMSIGSSFFSNAQYDSAEVYSKLALEINPGNIDALNNLAGIHFFNKKYEEAIRTYKIAIKLNPGFIDPYTNTAVCYLQLAKYDSAIYYSNKVLSLDSTVNTAQVVLGLCNQAEAKPVLHKKPVTVAQKKQLHGSKRLASR